MKVSRRKISKVIADQALDGMSTKKLSHEVAAYLLAEHRSYELNSVLRDVQELWAEQGIVDVMVTSAHNLTDRLRADITREVKKFFPHAKRVGIDSQYDPTILGGLRVEFANQQLDLSLRTKLNKFKQITTAGKD